MTRPNVRIVLESENGQAILRSPDPGELAGSTKMTLPASDVFRWLADAVDHGRAWLQDFVDDEVTLSSDLYDVIVAHHQFLQDS